MRAAVAAGRTVTAAFGMCQRRTKEKGPNKQAQRDERATRNEHIVSLLAHGDGVAGARLNSGQPIAGKQATQGAASRSGF